jgi:KaiC domain protein
VSEDDDWFERALTDDGDDEGGGDGEASDIDGRDGEAGDGTAGDEAAAEMAESADEVADGDDADGGDGDGLFEDDFASAFEGAGGPGGAGPAVEDDAFGEDGPDPFAGEDGPDPFAGGEEGSAAEPLGDQPAESSIPRVDMGVEGLDQMIRGGVPERSLMTVIGSAGTGKTTFGLQFLHHGLEQGERAVYITLEESRERVLDSAEEKGMPFREHAAEDRLAVVDIDPVEMANSLQSIRSDLPRLVQEFGASRLVLDSVSLLELMYQDRAKRRNEVYGFTRSLKEAGVTTLLTSEASEDNAYASRHGIVEYLTDAVFVMQYVRPSDFREARLAIEIQKIRDADHSREMKPYEITDHGLNVYRQANIF